MQGGDPDAGKGIVLRAFDGEASDGIPTLTKGYLYIKRILVCFNLNTVRARPSRNCIIPIIVPHHVAPHM